MIFNKHYHNSALNLLVHLLHKHYTLVKSFLFDTYYDMPFKLKYTIIRNKQNYFIQKA